MQQWVIVHEDVRARVDSLNLPGEVGVDVGADRLDLEARALRIGVSVDELDDVRVVLLGVTADEEVDLPARINAQLFAITDDLHRGRSSFREKPGVAQTPEKYGVLRLVAVMEDLVEEFRRYVVPDHSDSPFLVRLGADENVLSRHFEVVLAKVGENPLEIVAVLTDGSAPMLVDQLRRDTRLDLGLEDVLLDLAIDGVLARVLFIEGG
ncbi:hypothetical protein [Pseudonocardia sp. H11422]|uniref:hypothetical protein n=1 Tax=Pseudonocardia sp. H11422 TaxID=2835866 RepID=UPI0027E31575|nr:hypothetical protein [Pseudonocardia sp. H11422]